MALAVGTILVFMGLFIMILISGAGATGVIFLLAGIIVIGWSLIQTSSKKNNITQVTPPQPKQMVLSAPPLNNQISEQKEGQSVEANQKNKERAIAYCKEGKRLFYEQQKAREALRAFNEALKYDASLLDAIEGKMQSLAVLG